MDKKLTQAKAVCGVMMSSAKGDTIIADSLWAAESLIEDAEKVLEAPEHPQSAPPEGGAIMSTTTGTGPDEGEEDSFSPLMVRLESAIHRLKLAANDLSDIVVEMPNTHEHGSAAFVVREVTRDLNLLYRSFEAWEATHEYTPRDMQPLMEQLRQIDADDDAVDRMLHGRTVLSPSVSPG